MSYRPPYQITSTILKYIQDISLLIGEINILNLHRPSPQLRRTNRIKSIQASLAIEGNSLSLEQVTDIIDNKRVLGPAKDIQEVNNAIAVYEQLSEWKPTRKGHLLNAHKLLMHGLIPSAGQFRKGPIGIMKGSKIEHLAPPAHLVPGQINDLLGYLKNQDELALIKGCVFHYEFEFIHPFADGNGRMGRLWQSLILLEAFPVFEFIPVEHMIKNHQKAYYHALSTSGKQCQSTPFIEYMLLRIKEALIELLDIKSIPDNFKSRMTTAFEKFGKKQFNRNDYMIVHKKISSATASRELRKATDLKYLIKEGDKRNTLYRFSEKGFSN